MNAIPVAASSIPAVEGSHPLAGATTCPLCHTPAPSAKSGDGDWTCTTCGQHWSARALETAAAYALYVAAHPRRTRAFEVAGTTAR
jgi:ribosomal protein L37AE/L43A